MTKEEKSQLPKPHNSYERADPRAESGMGDLDRAESTPTNRPDSQQHANNSRPGGKLTTPLPEDLPIDNPPIDEVEVEVGIGQEPNTPEDVRVQKEQESASEHDDKV